MRKLMVVLSFIFAFAVSAADKIPALCPTKADFANTRGHIQGGCTSEDAFFFSYNKGVFKFDRNGKVLKHVPAVSHTGDICYYKGKLYTAIAYYDKARKGKGAIQEYDTDLNELRRYELDFPIDGITCLNGTLYFGVGPNPQKLHRGNRVAKMPVDFSGKPEIFNIDHGYMTHFGPQAAANDGKNIFISFYCSEEDACQTGVFTPDLKLVKALKFNASIGFDVVPWLSKKDDLVFFRLREVGPWGKKDRIIDFFRYRNGQMVNVSRYAESEK